MRDLLLRAVSDSPSSLSRSTRQAPTRRRCQSVVLFPLIITSRQTEPASSSKRRDGSLLPPPNGAPLDVLRGVQVSRVLSLSPRCSTFQPRRAGAGCHDQSPEGESPSAVLLTAASTGSDSRSSPCTCSRHAWRLSKNLCCCHFLFSSLPLLPLEDR